MLLKGKGRLSQFAMQQEATLRILESMPYEIDAIRAALLKDHPLAGARKSALGEDKPVEHPGCRCPVCGKQVHGPGPGDGGTGGEV